MINFYILASSATALQNEVEQVLADVNKNEALLHTNVTVSKTDTASVYNVSVVVDNVVKNDVELLAEIFADNTYIAFTSKKIATTNITKTCSICNTDRLRNSVILYAENGVQKTAGKNCFSKKFFDIDFALSVTKTICTAMLTNTFKTYNAMSNTLYPESLCSNYAAIKTWAVSFYNENNEFCNKVQNFFNSTTILKSQLEFFNFIISVYDAIKNSEHAIAKTSEKRQKEELTCIYSRRTNINCDLQTFTSTMLFVTASNNLVYYCKHNLEKDAECLKNWKIGEKRTLSFNAKTKTFAKVFRKEVAELDRPRA